MYCIFSKLEFLRSGENSKENTVKMVRKETSWVFYSSASLKGLPFILLINQSCIYHIFWQVLHKMFLKIEYRW